MASLAILQNRMKRHPGAYTDDFVRQLSHFEATRTLLLEQTTPQSNKETAKHFGKLAAFLAAVAPCYPQNGGKKVPELIISLLDTHASNIEPDLRQKLLQSLILLRAKGLISPDRLIEVCFGLFRVRDKPFRAALYAYIVKDVRIINKAKTNVELNRTLQSLVFKMLSDDERTAGTPAAAKRALSVVIELYKRRVWTDARAVNVVADACFSRIPRNAVAAARFFLGIDDEIDELMMKDEDDEDDGNPMNIGTKRDEKAKKLRSSLMAPKVAKKTKGRERKRQRAKNELKRLENNERSLSDAKTSEAKRYAAPRFPAIDLIHDPQTFAERLLKTVRSSSDRFEIRLVQLNLVSRVVGHHKLLLFPFYSFCQRYLQPHHESINTMLACVIQASHNMVPPDEVEPTVKLLANNFINDRTGSEVMAVGLNAIRELISRIPLLSEGEGMKDLIADLIAYRKYRRDRSVIIAARSLLLELRRINPRVLAPKERGKFHNLENRPLDYGAEKVADGVEGVDLLEDWLALHGDENGEDHDGDDGEEDDQDEDFDGEDIQEEDEDIDEMEDDEENGDEDDDDAEEWSEELDDEEDDDEGAEDEEEDQQDESPRLKRSAGSDVARSEVTKRVKRLDATRILTEEDFKKIRALKKLEAEGKIKRKAPESTSESASAEARKHRPAKQLKIMGYTLVQEGEEDEEPDNERSEVQTEHTFEVESLGSSEAEDDDEKQYDPAVVNPTSLDGVKKKNRRELAEKLNQIQAENEAKKVQRSNRIVNNTEKAKRTKDFLMVQKSRQVRKKQTLSIREQQAHVSKHMKTLQKKSKLLTKVRRKG